MTTTQSRFSCYLCFVDANDPRLFSFSYPGGQPPTPTRTPTSPNFFLDSLETPKQDYRFHDPRSPWSVAFASTLSPELRAQAAFTTPSKSPTTPSKVSRSEASSLNVRLSPSLDQASPVLSFSHPSSSAVNTTTAAKIRQTLLQASHPSIPYPNFGLDHDPSTVEDPESSIQTPPPTSTSVTRKKAQRVQLARLVEVSAVKDGKRRMSAVDANEDLQGGSATQPEDSPSHFPTLQFSPDGNFPFLMSGLATAPVYPQQKLFWDPDQNVAPLNVDLPMDDTFGMGLPKNLDHFTFAHDPGNAMQFTNIDGPAVMGATTNYTGGFTSSGHADALNQTNVSPSTAIMTHGRHGGTVVNPSMLFSSPGRASEATGLPQSSKTVQDDSLQPYAHQLRDAQIEKEIKERKPKRKRGAEFDSPAVKAAMDALREDRSNPSSSRSPVKESFSTPSRPGLSQPERARRGHHRFRSEGTNQDLRRHGNQTMISRHRKDAPSGRRTAVSLKIDSSGRAKTETTVVTDDAKPTRTRMDIDNSSNDSDSGSASSSEGIVLSQNQSFHYNTQKLKHPRLRHSIDESRLTDYSQGPPIQSGLSSANATEGIYMRQTPSHTRRSSQARLSGHVLDISGGQGNGNESEAETVMNSDEDKGDAQSELRKVLRDRAHTRVSTRSSGSRQRFGNPQRPQLHQAAPQNPYYTTHNTTPGQLIYQDPYSNISPTTITDPDMTTPSSGQESNFSSGTTRCICNGSEGNDQLMIQWLEMLQTPNGSPLLTSK